MQILIQEKMEQGLRFYFFMKLLDDGPNFLVFLQKGLSV
jgi:hypothetical protein